MTIQQLLLALRKRFYLLFGKRYIIKKTLNGTFLLDILNHIDRRVEVNGHYEKEQTEYLLSLLESSGCHIFFDVGANWGYYSILLLNRILFKETEIYAFEPDPVNRAQLFSNIFLNRLQDRITVFDVGLSNIANTVGFSRYGDENRGRSRIDDSGQSTIKVHPLDELVRFSGKLVGIKIDVEEHEFEVLDGMMNLLLSNKCTIQVEIFEQNVSKVKAKMNSIGYNCTNCIGNDYYFSNCY